MNIAVVMAEMGYQDRRVVAVCASVDAAKAYAEREYRVTEWYAESVHHLENVAVLWSGPAGPYYWYSIEEWSVIEELA